ncbi:MAG TPA: hypothetical protein VEL47_06800 [Myxococcota bacterium]|nr:hypothetical protein [Myxococcota bacterium]
MKILLLFLACTFCCQLSFSADQGAKSTSPTLSPTSTDEEIAAFYKARGGNLVFRLIYYFDLADISLFDVPRLEESKELEKKWSKASIDEQIRITLQISDNLCQTLERFLNLPDDRVKSADANEIITLDPLKVDTTLIRRTRQQQALERASTPLEISASYFIPRPITRRVFYADMVITHCSPWPSEKFDAVDSYLAEKGYEKGSYGKSVQRMQQFYATNIVNFSRKYALQLNELAEKKQKICSKTDNWMNFINDSIAECKLYLADYGAVQPEKLPKQYAKALDKFYKANPIEPFSTQFIMRCKFNGFHQSN